MAIKITGVVRNPETSSSSVTRSATRDPGIVWTPQGPITQIPTVPGIPGRGGGGGGSGAVVPTVVMTSGGVTINGQGFSVRPEDISSFVASYGGTLSQEQQRIIQERLSAQREQQLVQKAKESGTKSLTRSELIALGRGATQVRKGREEQLIKRNVGESQAAYEGRLLSLGRGIRETSPYTTKGYVEEEKKRLKIEEFEKKLKEPIGFTTQPKEKKFSKVLDIAAGERGTSLIGLGIPGTSLFIKAKTIGEYVEKKIPRVFTLISKIQTPLAKKFIIPQKVVREEGKFVGTLAKEIIPITPLETAIVGAAATRTIAGTFVRGGIGVLGIKTLLNPEQPLTTRILGGVSALAVVAPTGRNLFFKKVIVEKPAIIEGKTFREAKNIFGIYREEQPPLAGELKFSINQKGNIIAGYKQTGYTKQPTIKYETTRFKEFLGVKPKKFELIAPREYTARTLLPVIGEGEVVLGIRKAGARFIDINILTGTSRPVSVQELPQLPPIKKFVVNRLIEKQIGRLPGKLPNILKAERNLFISDEITATKIMRIRKPSGKKVYITTPKPGKTTTLNIAATEIKPFIETDFLRISTGETIFKDVSKPFARTTGKTPSLKTEIIEIKQPISVGTKDTGVRIIQPANIKKTPLQITFAKQKQKQIASILNKISGGIPKTRLVRKTIRYKEPTKPISVMIELPRMVGGAGLTEEQIIRFAGKQLPGITQPVIEEDSRYTFDGTLKRDNILSAKENIMTGNVERIKIRDLQIGKLSTPQVEEFKIQPKEMFKSMLQPKEVQKQREIQKEITKLSQKEMLKILQKQKQQLKTKQISIGKQTPFKKVPPLTFITPEEIGKSPLDIALGKLKGKSVDILVGMKKEKMRILARRLPPYLALKKASQYVEENIEASFKLVPSKKKPVVPDIPRFELGKQFRPSKREPLYLVEKTKYRLNMPREKSQIKLGKRTKSKRRKLKIF